MVGHLLFTRTRMPVLLCFVLVLSAVAQDTVFIHVQASQTIGSFKPIYAYFGYDEANFTYTRNGTKLIGELGALSRAPVYIRTHFLLATGDGTPGLKWSSTNAYREDSSGKPIYDWKIIDRIFDTFVHAGAVPFVEVGFMPQALSSKPEPYRPTWIPGTANKEYAIGWSYPPNDYNKWEELVYQWVLHSVQKYGRHQVEQWYWEVWNEPDISYWHGTPEEYDKLYDYTAAAIKRALPSAKIAGPAVTGPSNPKAAAFLQQFLEHCDHGTNFATASVGAPLDVITYHAKGRPALVDGHVRMGIAKHLQDVDAGFKNLRSFVKFRDLPIVLSESDPEGCAACSALVYPENAYRNGTLYAVYTAVVLKNIFELADRERTDIAGMLTWAFEFEDQPYFAGFRTLATNGIDKPVLNLFRLLGLMQGDRVQTDSSRQTPLQTMLKSGVGGQPDVDALAVARDRQISVLVWNYQDDDMRGTPAKVQLTIRGFANGTRRALVREYRIDETHNNSWTMWKNMGSPQRPSSDQYAALEAAAQLQLFDSPRWIDIQDGERSLNLVLPSQSVSLLQLSW